MSEIKIKKSKFGKNPEIMIHETQHLSMKAKVALSMVERWGMVVAETGDEDSEGRATKRVMPVEDVVGRACSITDELFAELDRRGWIDSIPSLSELEKQFPENDE